MIFDMDRTRLAVIAAASAVLIASIIGFVAFGDNDGEVASAGTIAEASITSLLDTTPDVSVPTVDEAGTIAVTAPPLVTSDNESSSTELTASSDSSQSAPESTATFTSSPVVEGELRGCADGLVLVGSNGTEPICQEPGAGCPDGYVVIGGVNQSLLCKGEAGDVLRVQPDGTVTIDTSAPFSGPVCQRLDASGNVAEITLAIDADECSARGGVYFPNGLD